MSNGASRPATVIPLHAAFRRPSDAVAAAIEAQQALTKADWSAVGGLTIRMAVHVGTAERREGDYFGPALIAAERESVRALRLLGTHALDDL